MRKCVLFLYQGKPKQQEMKVEILYDCESHHIGYNNNNDILTY